MPVKFARAGLPLILLAATVADIAANDVPAVNVKPIPATTTTTFPVATPPADLPDDHDADADLGVGVTGGDATGTFDGTTLTITAVAEVTVEGKVTIRLPDDASQALKDHESGHDDLYRDEYNRTAKSKAEDAFRGLKGMKFVGDGATAAERKTSAEKKASDEVTRRQTRAKDGILDQAGTLNDKYDDLTAHGTSATVNTAQGKAAAKKELGLASAAGSSTLIPDQGSVLAGTVGAPSVTFDPETGELTFDFAGGVIGFSSAGVNDPILGATLSLLPLQLIGLQENGTIRLATSEFDITLPGLDMSLLHGYLVEAAYIPTGLLGFPGMIQGFLDIPPPFTGAGINNTVGSGFLNDYQALFLDENLAQRSMLSFFVDQPLFDDQGNSLSTFSTGMLQVGAAVPEPSTMLLAVLGIASFGYRRYCHRRYRPMNRRPTALARDPRERTFARRSLGYFAVKK